MNTYLLGVVTLPALWLTFIALNALASWLRGWDTVTCGICDKEVAWGPRRPLIRLHCLRAHGLALTLRGRIRRKQWHGLSNWYANQHGVSDEEWRAAVAAHEAPPPSDREASS